METLVDQVIEPEDVQESLEEEVSENEDEDESVCDLGVCKVN